MTLLCLYWKRYVFLKSFVRYDLILNLLQINFNAIESCLVLVDYVMIWIKEPFYKERKINNRCFDFLSKQNINSSTNPGHKWFLTNNFPSSTKSVQSYLSEPCPVLVDYVIIWIKEPFYKERKINNRCSDFLSKQNIIVPLILDINDAFINLLLTYLVLKPSSPNESSV